jgi:hypothetical protein
MRTFLLVSILCLVVFVGAWIVAGELIPFWAPQPEVSLRGEGTAQAGLSLWAIVQNVSALAGIISFLIQIAQWRRGGA